MIDEVYDAYAVSDVPAPRFNPYARGTK